jgi:hypothetical protein
MSNIYKTSKYIPYNTKNHEFSIWYDTYKRYLNHIYSIYVDKLLTNEIINTYDKKNNLTMNKTYIEFCEMIYLSSSRHLDFDLFNELIDN